jgi:hypothetical protein
MKGLSRDSLVIDNFDTIVNENEIKDVQEGQVHELLPKHPYRMLLLGSSGVGKTNILLNLLTKQLVYDRIYLFSRHLEQAKYKFLKKHLEDIEENLKEAGINQKIIMAWENTLQKLPSVEDLDADYRNTIIIDDFAVTEKKNSKRIAELFVRSRHRNASVIFLTQLMFKCDRDIRLNCSHFILLQSHNKRELTSLSMDLGADLDKGVFKELYNKVLAIPYQFLLLDNTARGGDPKRYRIGFNRMYDGNLNEGPIDIDKFIQHY